MKYILSLFAVASILSANDYYAKIEAISTYNVKSSVSGKVVFANNKMESKITKNNTIIRIDDKINKLELIHTKDKKVNLQKVLNIQKSILASFNKVSSKSQLEKDQQEITILNTKANLNDLSVRISTLKDMISNKTLNEKNKYISSINVDVGDYVNPGSLLYTAQDLSKGKLEIFVSFDDVDSIKDKKIYINDEISDLKINKIYKTADKVHISSYKVEILINKTNSFSKLVKITFK